MHRASRRSTGLRRHFLTPHPSDRRLDAIDHARAPFAPARPVPNDAADAGPVPASPPLRSRLRRAAP